MKWLEVNIETLSSDDGMPVELVIGALMESGVHAVQTLDDYDTRLFLENNADSWDYADEALLNASKSTAIVRLYLQEEFSAEALLLVHQNIARLKAGEFGDTLGTLNISITSVDDSDWEDAWKKYYKPFRVGQHFIIRPEWEAYSPVDNDIVLSLNPGQVFGTGLHQSTKLCLETLERLDLRGNCVLDLGCGSGILAIAARLLGAAHVDAVDIDKAAKAVVTENAMLNSIDLTSGFGIYCGNILTDESLAREFLGSYDVILANIVADVIIAMSPLAKKFINPSGLFISSGIISQRKNDVADALEASGFVVIEECVMDEWVSLVARNG